MATEAYIPADKILSHPAMQRNRDGEERTPAQPSQFIPAPVPPSPPMTQNAPFPTPPTTPRTQNVPTYTPSPPTTAWPPSTTLRPSPPPTAWPPSKTLYPEMQRTPSGRTSPFAPQTRASTPPPRLYQSPQYSTLPSLKGHSMPMANTQSYGTTQQTSPPPEEDHNHMEKGYGATPYILRPKEPKEKGMLPHALVICCIILPLILYSLTYYILAYIRYSSSLVAYIIAAVLFLVTLAIGAAALTCPKLSDRLWLGLLCVLSFAGCFTAAVLAERAYTVYMQPYYALQQLNVYENVNPSSARGNQYMDFGILNFVASASVDSSLATQFKNRDTYCAAPITSGSSPQSYEFWAVGMNCCSDGFRCGDWNSNAPHSGLRITGESQKQWFELAARQAAAKYNISVGEPVFVQWVTQPVASIEALAGSAVLRFIKGLFLFGGINFFIVVLSTIPFLKHWI